jgi:serine/threonine protein kinase/Flp pilus assembly protein TadD
MATVYLAQDLKHGRQVALKVLHPDLAASLGSERFLREIQIAARLQHPHILPLYDSGQIESSDGTTPLLYYVMPFVEGESLRDRLHREKPLPVDEAVRIGRDIAAALDYAHRHGVVHRDIKPENVMLHEGEAMVTDFGIAKAVSAAGSESLTQTGLAVGTPAYMSPEQASGEREPDGRSDIYSLGCLLYEMLAGVAPFTGPNVQALMMKRFTEPVPSVRATRPAVSPDLDQVVTRALAKDPEERFATASQLVVALGSPRVTTPPEATLVTSVAANKKSIAVLPFADMSPQKDQDYFCEGIAEEIINALSKIEALHVASRSSAFAFKGHQDVRKVGQQLGAGTVLEGSVRKSGNRLRISAQLINVANGYQLWSERYDRELEDVFAIQDEIAENIVRALRVVLSEDEKRAIEVGPRADVQAYDYYLRGRQFLHQFRRTSVQFARRMFERAMEIDPTYVRAYAGAADCCSFLYMYWDASKANLEGADTYTRRALELGPEVAEAHASRGLALSLSKRYQEADQEFETAIRLNPNLYEAHYFYGRALFQQGKYADVVRCYAEAARVRPEDYQTRILAVPSLRRLGRTAEAEAMLRQGVELAQKHVELNPDDARALVLGGGVLMQIGEPAKALEWAERGIAVDPEDSSVLYNVACIYALGGKPQEALDCLDKAVRNGFGHREWLENDSDLDSLRQDPRFEALLKRL